MTIFSKPMPILTPEDLGVDLEEDSTDVSEEDVLGAVDTDNLLDMAEKVREFVGIQKPSFELRRKSGILYSRVTLEGGQHRLFKIEWIRKGLTHE